MYSYLVAEDVSKDVGNHVGKCQKIKEIVESNSELLSFSPSGLRSFPGPRFSLPSTVSYQFSSRAMLLLSLRGEHEAGKGDI